MSCFTADLMEERKMKRICLERPACFSRAKEDFISKLPDSLISQILFYLRTKKAVTTSVLSKRWKSVWLWTPALVLSSDDFPDYNAFVSFMDKFLDFSREHKACLHKLKLSIRKGENDQTCVTRWIDFVATPKLKHLDVEFGPMKRECWEVIPSSLYICESLLYLRLHQVVLGKFESVSLPCLKTMRLEQNIYANEACLESLISSCPVLEDLSFVRRAYDNVKVLRVHSQTLTSLNIEGGALFYSWVEDLDIYLENSEVLIDAPRLKYWTFEDDQYESKTIRNPSSLTKVNLLGDFHLKNSADEVDLQKLYMVPNFFTSISGVRDMKISCNAFAFIKKNMPFSTKFYNLSCLEVDLFLPSLKTPPTFLESFPNLKSLTLDLRFCSLIKQLSLSFVPRCLLSSLEFVEIKECKRTGGRLNMEHERYVAGLIETELASYFAENSTILKKLVLPLRSSMPEEKDSIDFWDFLVLPRRSSTCQIIYVADR